MKDSLKNSNSVDRKATSIRAIIWKGIEKKKKKKKTKKKKKKAVSSRRIKIFCLNIVFPLIAIMVSKKIWMD